MVFIFKVNITLSTSFDHSSMRRITWRSHFTYAYDALGGSWFQVTIWELLVNFLLLPTVNGRNNGLRRGAFFNFRLTVTRFVGEQYLRRHKVSSSLLHQRRIEVFLIWSRPSLQRGPVGLIYNMVVTLHVNPSVIRPFRQVNAKRVIRGAIFSV